MSNDTAQRVEAIRQMRERWAKAAELQEQLGQLMAEIYQLSGADATDEDSAKIYNEHAINSREIVATYDKALRDIERRHAGLN